MTSRIAVAFLVLAAACSTPEPEPANPPGDAVPPGAAVPPAAPETRTVARAYKVIGTEPFWGLEISDTGLRFSTPDNIDGAGYPPVEPVASGDTLTWRTEANGSSVEARIWPARCSDGMSDRIWTYAAAVSVDTVNYSGCADPAP